MSDKTYDTAKMLNKSPKNAMKNWFKISFLIHDFSIKDSPIKIIFIRIIFNELCNHIASQGSKKMLNFDLILS
jgi:hypothetical protein